MVHDALEAIKAATRSPQVPLILLSDTKAMCDSFPIRWDLYAKYCPRRIGAYQYFGALGNIIADKSFRQLISRDHLGVISPL
jgi:hypothetical protein